MFVVNRRQATHVRAGAAHGVCFAPPPPFARFLDRGLDEVGPKGLDFLTVLAAHEGEGLVADRCGGNVDSQRANNGEEGRDTVHSRDRLSHRA